MKVPFYKPPVGEEEAQAVYETVKSGWLTFGKKTEQFEEEFAKYIGAPYAVMLDNCTAALSLACEYFGRDLPEKRRKWITVGVPSLTCAATAIAPLHAGYPVAFMDLRQDESFLMEPGFADAYIPVHFAGKRCEVPENKIIVEDCAHRIIKDGFTGRLQAYSFYVTKCMTTGEGGAIACATKEQADWFKQARLYGNSKAIFERDKMYQSGNDFWWFESAFVGWKANPTDLAATIGLVQLKKLDNMNADRKRLAEVYNQAFGVNVDREPWHLYPILINERDKFMHHMRDNEVYTSVHFPPLHMMKAFKGTGGMLKRELPVTEFVYNHIVSLPLYPYMTAEEQGRVIDLTADWIKQYGRPELPQPPKT